MASFTLRVVALGVAVVVFILALLDNTEMATLVSLLSVGLLALALDAFMKRRA